MTNDEAKALIEYPIAFAHLLGYNLLEGIHNEWIKTLLWRDADYTLQAHRDSYKTTCLIVAVTMAIILRPELTILLLRKESGSTVEFVRAVKKNLQSDIAQSFSMAVNKKPIQLLKDTQTEIHTNLFTDQGSW